MRLGVTLSAASIAVGLLALSLVRAVSASHAAPAAWPAARTPDLYTDRVQPIFQAECYRCHAGLNHRGGFQMDTQAGLMKGGHDGPAIVPGHPEQSLLVRLIRHEGPLDDPRPMPLKSKLVDADIAAIETWIRAGAVMPPASMK